MVVTALRFPITAFTGDVYIRATFAPPDLTLYKENQFLEVKA